MATIFPFVFLRNGFREYLSYRTAVTEQSAGRRIKQKLHAVGELVVRGSILFPNTGGDWPDFAAFWDARFGGFGNFLYKRQDPGFAAVQDVFAAVAAQTDFDATRRYVDVSTVVVKKAGVTQTLTTHYVLENESGAAYVLGTSTKLVVAFVSAPGAAVAVTIDYEHYVPMSFEGDDLPDEQEMHAGGRGSTTIADRTIALQLREAAAGASYASAPDAL